MADIYQSKSAPYQLKIAFQLGNALVMQKTQAIYHSKVVRPAANSRRLLAELLGKKYS